MHPHILPLHDSGEADGFLFYVMPYVAGESLRSRLEREREALRILERGGMIAGDFYIPMAEQTLWVLERGRIHRRLGNREEALRDFSYVAAIWETADDVLQPLVTEAREAAAELSRER
jgi:hypothetical protein